MVINSRPSIYASYNERTERTTSTALSRPYTGASRVIPTKPLVSSKITKRDPPMRAYRPQKIVSTQRSIPAVGVAPPLYQKPMPRVHVSRDGSPVIESKELTRLETGMNAFFTRQATGKTPAKLKDTAYARIPQVEVKKRTILPDPLLMLDDPTREAKIKSELDLLQDLEALLLNEIALAE